MRQDTVCVNHLLCAALAVAIFIDCTFSRQAAAEPSAQEILDMSRAAMAPPIQYRIHANNDVDMLISQKILSDGSPASRTETSSPIAKVSLILADESYEFYPDHGLAIDTQFMYRGAKTQATAIASALKGHPTHSAQLKGTAARDGKECFEIETTVAPEAAALLGKALPADARKMLPKRNRIFIERNTYLIVATESISDAGSSISTLKYKDIKQRPDLSDDLFLPPNGLELKKPTSINEYLTLLGDILTTKAVRPRPSHEELWALPDRPPLHPRRRLGPVTIDSKTGQAIAPLPPGMSREEFDHRVAAKRAEIRAASESEPEVTGMSPARKIGIATSLITIVSLLAIAWRRSTKSSAEPRDSKRRPDAKDIVV